MSNPKHRIKPIPEKLPVNVDPEKLEIARFVVELKMREESDRCEESNHVPRI